jgi:predicted PurR-regulated permease PerM
MQLNGVASSILVGWFIVLSLLVLAAIGGMAFVLWKINAKIEQLTPKVEPLLDKVDQAFTTANDKLTSIGDRAEHIAAQGEETAANVHDKVEKTATVVQRTIHAPLIVLNSFAAGLSRSVKTFSNLQQKSDIR